MKKAIDYYNEYRHRFFGVGLRLEDINESLVKLIKDFINEMHELQKVRHVKRPEALASIIHELNQKWNALSRMFEKYHGVSPMKEDGFRNALDVLTRADVIKKEVKEDA